MQCEAYVEQRCTECPQILRITHFTIATWGILWPCQRILTTSKIYKVVLERHTSLFPCKILSLKSSNSLRKLTSLLLPWSFNSFLNLQYYTDHFLHDYMECCLIFCMISHWHRHFIHSYSLDLTKNKFKHEAKVKWFSKGANLSHNDKNNF